MSEENAGEDWPKQDIESGTIGALAHLYRAEVFRSTHWRTRLDNTTNWAVVTTGIALSATFANREASPLPMVLVGLLTIFSMLKIWRGIFWGKPSGESRPVPRSLTRTSLALGLVTVAIGLACAPMFDLAQSAASGLLDPQAYLDAVLGTGNPASP